MFLFIAAFPITVFLLEFTSIKRSGKSVKKKGARKEKEKEKKKKREKHKKGKEQREGFPFPPFVPLKYLQNN